MFWYSSVYSYVRWKKQLMFVFWNWYGEYYRLNLYGSIGFTPISYEKARFGMLTQKALWGHGFGRSRGMAQALTRVEVNNGAHNLFGLMFGHHWVEFSTWLVLEAVLILDSILTSLWSWLFFSIAEGIIVLFCWSTSKNRYWSCETKVWIRMMISDCGRA